MPTRDVIVRRCAVRGTELPAWLAQGYRVVRDEPLGMRGAGDEVLVEWRGEGEAPEPSAIAG